MSKRLQGIVIGFLLGVLLAGSIAIGKVATQNIQVNYNNVKVYKDKQLTTLKDANGATIEPFIYNGTTYLPVRAVANLAGMDVTWDNATKSVYLWQNMKPSDSYYLVAVASPYDSKNCSIYDADEYFYMDNVAYHSGFRLWTSSGYAQYNLQNKYSTMEVTIGHTDYFDRSKTVTFIVDGRNVGTVSLPAGCKPQRYAVNLYNGQNLKISVSGAGEVGFGNIVVK